MLADGEGGRPGGRDERSHLLRAVFSPGGGAPPAGVAQRSSAAKRGSGRREPAAAEADAVPSSLPVMKKRVLEPPSTTEPSGPSPGRMVGLLRGINVGRAKRVAMADLRAIVEGLGYGGVRTLLNSGNVVFDAPGTAPGEAARGIEEALAARLGIRSRVTVLAAAELAAAIDDNPLLAVAADPARFLVAVLADAAGRARLAPLAEQEWEPEAVALGARVAYLWCPTGILASRLLAAVGRVLGDGVTTRNLATMIKLNDLARRDA